jgi:hypothetical protein
VSCDTPSVAAAWCRRIPVDMSARAVNDIDLLLLGLRAVLRLNGICACVTNKVRELANLL